MWFYPYNIKTLLNQSPGGALWNSLFFYIIFTEMKYKKKLNKKKTKIKGLNIHYKANAYNEAAQYRNIVISNKLTIVFLTKKL